MSIAYIIGYYGHRNFGDEVMLEILINQLMSSGYRKIYFESGDNPRRVKAYPVVYQKFNNASAPRLFRGIINLFRDFRASQPKLSEADLIVLGGGSLLSDSTSIVTLFKILCKLWYSKVNRARIISVGLGVGSLRTTIRRILVRSILQQIEVVAVRDKLSSDSLIRCDRTQIGKIQLASDLFYLLDVTKSRYEPKSDGIVGLTIAPPYLYNNITPEKFSAAINTILAKLRFEVKEIKLIVFQKHDDKKYCDTSYFQKIEGLLNFPAEIIDCPDNVPGALEIISDVNYIIGMRYHSLVLASLVGIPFIGIGTEKKIISLTDEFQTKVFTLGELHNIEKLENYTLPEKLSMQETLHLLVERAEKYKSILK